MRKRLFNYLRLFFGVTILFLIFYKIGFVKIWETLTKINLLWVTVALFFLLLSILLNTINLKLLFNTINPKIRTFELFKYFCFARTISMFLPGRLGDFSLVFFLKKYSINIGQGSAVMLIDKLITFLVFILLGIIGINTIMGKGTTIKCLIVLTITIIPLFLLFAKKGRHLIKKYILKKHAIVFQGFSKKLFDLLKYHKKLLILNLLNTNLRAIILGLHIFFVYLALGTNINLLLIILIESIITIIKLIPITPNGLGLRELTSIYLYSLIGVPKEIIAARYVITIILDYCYGLFVIYWIKSKTVN